MRMRLTIIISFSILVVFSMFGFEVLERSLAEKYRTLLEVSSNKIDKSVPSEYKSGSSEMWARENIYINTSLFSRQGKGPFLLGQNYSPRTSGEKDDVRILVVGDSYTYGVGAADPDMLWHHRVLQKLEREYPGTKIEMLTLASPGASLIEEVEWLSDEVLRQVDPDIIMFGHVRNDFTPSGREYGICGGSLFCEKMFSKNIKEYTDCILGIRNGPSKWINTVVRPSFPLVSQAILLRFCETRQIESAEIEPSHNSDYSNSKYYSLIMNSFDRLAKINKSYPIVSTLLIHNGVMGEVLSNTKNELKSRGIKPVENSSSIFDSSGLPLIGLIVNPADNHPGSYITSKLAKDSFIYIKNNHKEIFNKGNETENFYPRSIISSFLPVSLAVGQNKSGVVSIISQPSDSYLYGLSAEFPEPQQTPCAWIGKTHIRVMLDLKVLNRSKVILDSISSNLFVYAVGYDNEGVPTIREVGRAKADSSFAFKLKQGESGLLFSPFDSIPCDSNQKLPAPHLNFEMSLI